MKIFNNEYMNYYIVASLVMNVVLAAGVIFLAVKVIQIETKAAENFDYLYSKTEVLDANTSGLSDSLSNANSELDAIHSFVEHYQDD